MIEQLKKKLCNKQGAILMEILTGLAIFAITVVTFAGIITQANVMTLRAQVSANEWDRIFVKMEKEDYGTEVGATVPVNIVLRLEDVERKNVILDDGTPNGTPLATSGDLAMGLMSVTLVANQRFIKYEESVAHYASPRTGKVAVYTLIERP